MQIRPAVYYVEMTPLDTREARRFLQMSRVMCYFCVLVELATLRAQHCKICSIRNLNRHLSAAQDRSNKKINAKHLSRKPIHFLRPRSRGQGTAFRTFCCPVYETHAIFGRIMFSALLRLDNSSAFFLCARLRGTIRRVSWTYSMARGRNGPDWNGKEGACSDRMRYSKDTNGDQKSRQKCEDVPPTT